MTNTIGNEENEHEEILYEYPDTRGEILLHCYNAIAATEMADTYLSWQVKQKDNIKAKALDVIEYYMNEIHAEIFDVTNE
jgi:hypothetical protein